MPEPTNKVVPKAGELFVIIKASGSSNKELVWHCDYVEGDAIIAHLAYSEYTFSDTKERTSRVFIVPDYEFQVVTPEFLSKLRTKHPV